MPSVEVSRKEFFGKATSRRSECRLNFYQTDLTDETLWRSIILFGRNVASYKFALAKALLEQVQTGASFVRMDDLAPDFAKHLCQHLEMAPKQVTSSSSKFLEACREYNLGEISKDQLVEETVRRGFVNVIDAFHIVNQGEIPIRFFIDDRKKRKGITLTDELLGLTDSRHMASFPHEIEARWRLVETAWSLDVSPHLLEVGYSDVDEALVINDEHRRINITSSRNALNGYQKGRCFYCRAFISVEPAAPDFCDVDHFFPHVLTQGADFENININGAWNLVLSCRECNRGVDGKFAKIPKPSMVQRLYQRNEYYVGSHHPLKETIINQTGRNPNDRGQYLQEVHNAAISNLVYIWEPREREIDTGLGSDRLKA